MLKFTDGAAINFVDIGAFPEFTTLVTEGTELGNDNLPDENKEVSFEQKGDNFILKVALIPKEKAFTEFH